MSKQYAHLHTMAKTSVKINLRIMSKQYAQLHTMVKTSVKNDWPKTVGGVALTRHPL